MTRKRIVEAAFSAAAKSYDQAAEAQARAADLLVDSVRGLALPPAPSVLEIGCGTGLLTRRLLPLIGGDWQITDLSAAMVAEAKTVIGENAQFRVMDGEHPDPAAGPVDLVVSNLAAQWFADLPAAIGRLSACLKPGGALALTTLGAGSFAEWKQAHRRLGLACGIPPYPTAGDLAAQLPGARVTSQPIVIHYADGRDFLAALKRIGAATPAEGHQPLSPGALRRVLKAMGAPAPMTYDVVTVTLIRGQA
jgi:malonyl-CoA O-methyltransferase